VVSQYRVNSEDDDGNYFSINDQLLWETMKVMKRGKTISYSSYKNKEKTKSESDLEKQLSELYANNGNETEIQDTESKLRQLREKQIKGIMTRAKAKWGMEGEKCSRYFCNLEKRNFVGKTIPNLTLDDGRVIEDIKLILSEQKEYYKHLYSSKQTVISQDNSGIVFDNYNPFLTKLTEDEMVGMKGELTLPECLKVLKNMSYGKSPGLDGFTSEFCKFFWIDIQEYVIKS
jgi:hypothetical protein